QIERIGRKAEEGVATLRDALSASPSGKSAGMERILDMLSFGVVLVSRPHVVFANRTARHIHESDGGLVIGKTVSAPSSRLSGELATIIEAACSAARQDQEQRGRPCGASTGEADLRRTGG